MLRLDMDPLDESLCRAHALYLEDPSDEVDTELATLIPRLLAAGYVEDRLGRRLQPLELHNGRAQAGRRTGLRLERAPRAQSPDP